MSINSFISRISKIIINNFKLYLTIITTFALVYMYLFISIYVVMIFNKRPDPLFDYLKTLNYKTYIFYLLILSIFLTIFLYVFANLKAQKANLTDKNHQYLKRTYNYYRVLPLFMISFGFLLTTFNTNTFMTFGVNLLLLGVLLFLIMYMIKSYCETKIHYTLNRASEILNDLDLDNKKSIAIKKFNRYFIKTLNNIDLNLKKGLKINDIKKGEENNSLKLPVKNAIIYYLPEFMKFGTKEQIYSLKNHIDTMLTFVNENDEFNLNVTNIILDIYNDIEKFLQVNNFVVTAHRRWFSLAVFKDKELLTAIFLIIYIILKGQANI
ncbi:MAG: hypothetical protein WC568_00775 [Candidatus Methanoperedens sp.]